MNLRCSSRSLRWWLTASVGVAIVLAACGGGGGGASSGPSGKPAALDVTSVKLPAEDGAVKFQPAAAGSGAGLKLGYISLGDQVPFVHLVSESIKQQADKSGAQLVFCDSREQTPVTLDCVRSLKTQGVQAYLNFQSDAGSSAAICAAGPQVPVIAIDIHQKPCETAFMGANNHYSGYIGGLALGEYFKRNFSCKYEAFVSMEDFAVGEVNDQRMGGFRDGFSHVCGSINNLRKENTGRIDKARTVFTDVLTSLPGQHHVIVVGINDDSVEGALAAAKTAGRQNDLYVAGTGADPSSWCEMKTNPQWIADSLYYPERYGEIGVPYLIKAAKGESVPSNLLVPHGLINSTNLEKFYHPTNC